jgi:magnesium-transporting ATPase (P-type)
MVIESVDLTVDEPGDDKDYGDAIVKGANDNDDVFLKAGSIVKTGNAKAIICAVGKDSTRGDKDEELDTSTKTTLEVKLQNLQNQILLFSAGSAVVVFV